MHLAMSLMTSISRDPDLPPFLSDPDSPIEDIDLPVNGPGVLRPGVSRLANGNVHVHVMTELFSGRRIFCAKTK